MEEKTSQLRTKGDKLRRYLTAHFSKAIIGTVWMMINVILFIEHFIRKLHVRKFSFFTNSVKTLVVYWNDPNFLVSFARGFGEILNFNCSLILVPVLRNLIT